LEMKPRGSRAQSEDAGKGGGIPKKKENVGRKGERHEVNF